MKQKPVEWIADLRRPDIKQGKGYLRSDNEYCCLGRLCEISGVSEWKGSVYENNYAYLPESVQEKYGLSSNKGQFNPEKVTWPDSIPEELRGSGSLVSLNDGGATFSQIADFIELNWEVL